MSLLSSNLETLDLTFNSAVTGTVPTEIGLLTNLRAFLLSFSSVTGTIPSEIGQLQSLEIFATADTTQTGSIPTEIGNLNATLSLFYIGPTLLAHPLPEEFYLLTNLKVLFQSWFKQERNKDLGRVFRIFQNAEGVFTKGARFQAPLPSK